MLQKLKVNPYSIIGLSYATAILLGAYLFTLPFFSLVDMGFLNAIYMATSAICVTGLSVIDVPYDLTFAGKTLLITLIQMGGMGVFVFSSMLLLLFRKNFSLLTSTAVEESLLSDGRVVFHKLILTVAGIIFMFEFFGAIFIFFKFYGIMDLGEAVFNSIFLSISSFCNAGFSIIPGSLSAFKTDGYLLSVVMLLIVFGGLGFFTITDLFKNYKEKSFRIWKYKLKAYSKAVLYPSIALIIFGAIAFYFIEYGSGIRSASSFYEKFLVSLFHSVSARTAGFSTIDFGTLAPASFILFFILMYIGAGSASTAGGIKVNTAMILIKYFTSNVKKRDVVFLFQRSVPRYAVKKAILLLFLSITWLALAIFTITIIEQENLIQGVFSISDIIFEVISALGTVGLSSAPHLHQSSNFVIVLTMFFGRTGLLTLLAWLSVMAPEEKFKYPEEDIFVG